jgi:hypothetical protein
MIRSIAVFIFVLVVGVCSYVLLNPNSYSTPVLCLVAFVLCVAACSVAPVWRIYLLPQHPSSRKRRVSLNLPNGVDAPQTQR